MNTTKNAFQLWMAVALVSLCVMPSDAEEVQPADLGSFREFQASPGSARGRYQMFYFTFEHRDSVIDIEAMKILFGSNKNDRTGFIIEVTPEGRVRYGINGRFGLGLDDGQIGENKVLNSRKFILDLKRSRMTQIGSSRFVIQLFLDFREKEISGRKRIYLGGTDIDFIESEFVQRGTFTFTDAATEHAPQLISMSPENGEGRGELFSFVIEDKDGAEDIRRIYIKYSRYKNSYYGVLGFTINPATREINARGNRFQTGVIGENGRLGSPNGIVDLGESSIGIDRLGDRYVVKLKLLFKNTDVGEKKFWVEAVDTGGRTSGRHEMGKYRVATSRSAPHPMFVLPATTSGPGGSATRPVAVQIFSFWWRDSDGLDDIKTLHVKFAAKPDEENERVHVSYNLRTASLVRSSTRIYGSVQFDSGQRVISDRARLYGRGSSFTKIDNFTARIDLALSFDARFAGKWNIYLRGEDFSGNKKAWRKLGTYIVNTGSSKPKGRRVVPFFATGVSEAFMFEFQDLDGPSDIDWAEAEFRHKGDDGTFLDSFILRYTQNDRTLRLFYKGRLFGGELGENKWVGEDGVRIDLRRCYAVHYKDRLQLFVYIEFDNAFIWGLKDVVLWARDLADLESRRQTWGGFNIPVDR